MSVEVVALAWIACALFFGIGHAVIAIAISRIPLNNLDKAIQYLEWVIRPFNTLMVISFASLIAAVVFLWVYAIIQTNVEAIVLSFVVSILSWLSYSSSKALLRQALLSHLRGDN